MPLSSDRKGRKIAEDGGGLTRRSDLRTQTATMTSHSATAILHCRPRAAHAHLPRLGLHPHSPLASGERTFSARSEVCRKRSVTAFRRSPHAQRAVHITADAPASGCGRERVAFLVRRQANISSRRRRHIERRSRISNCRKAAIYRRASAPRAARQRPAPRVSASGACASSAPTA